MLFGNDFNLYLFLRAQNHVPNGPVRALRGADSFRRPDRHRQVGVRTAEAHARLVQGQIHADIRQLLGSNQRQSDTGETRTGVHRVLILSGVQTSRMFYERMFRLRNFA